MFENVFISYSFLEDTHACWVYNSVLAILFFQHIESIFLISPDSYYSVEKLSVSLTVAHLKVICLIHFADLYDSLYMLEFFHSLWYNYICISYLAVKKYLSSFFEKSQYFSPLIMLFLNCLCSLLLGAQLNVELFTLYLLIYWCCIMGHFPECIPIHMSSSSLITFSAVYNLMFNF